MIGQEPMIKVLKSAIRQNRLGSAYLFSGPSGVGKTTGGRIFAKAVLCDSPRDGNPCGTCESCLLFSKDQHFGFKELDAASVGGKEDMVKLRGEAAFISITKKKIILIDECHDISRQGQDALLEQTERCPDHLIYIFCTTDPDKMNRTLRNRCMEFQVSRVDVDLITSRLKYICDQEKFPYKEEALQAIATRSNGHVRNAIKLLEEATYLGEINLENFNSISRDYDEEIFTIVANLGTDLNKIMESYRSISSYLSSIEFYNLLLQMVNDATKLLCGFEEFSGRRKELLEKLKDIHGFILLEFLNYLISRDKFIDKIGIQSDLIILHYKFSSNSFVPRQVESSFRTQNSSPVLMGPSQTVSSSKTTLNTSAPSLSHSQLLKMDKGDMCKILRDQRKNQKPEQKEESETVSANWPLPKDGRSGENSLDDDVLTPQEFSNKLVGGRGGDF
jgi:DNA polymerase III subunit gamma/tau